MHNHDPAGAARVNGTRLWSRLMAMGQIGATVNGGCNRQALTDGDLRGARAVLALGQSRGLHPARRCDRQPVRAPPRTA